VGLILEEKCGERREEERKTMVRSSSDMFSLSAFYTHTHTHHNVFLFFFSFLGG
jgi:hypothetical protein